MVKFTVRTLFLIFFPIIMATSGFIIGYLLISAFDAMTGLTWALLLGVGGFVGELIVNGLLSKKRNQWIAGIAIAALAFSGIGYLMYIGVLGSIFGPPIAPVAYQKGYAIIYFNDPFTNESINDVTLYIQYTNGTNYLNTTSDTTFYVPEASYFYATKGGRFNFSGAVWATGTTPAEAFETRYLMAKICPKEYVNVSIVKIDDTYGSYTASNISDGHHTILLDYKITGVYYNTSIYGQGSYVPPMFIPYLSYAYNYTEYTMAVWIGWNGTIENYRLGGSPVGVFPVYDIGVYNSSYIYGFGFYGEFEIEADFTSIVNATIYYGLLDNYTQWAIPI